MKEFRELYPFWNVNEEYLIDYEDCGAELITGNEHLKKPEIVRNILSKMFPKEGAIQIPTWRFEPRQYKGPFVRESQDYIISLEEKRDSGKLHVILNINEEDYSIFSYLTLAIISPKDEKEFRKFLEPRILTIFRSAARIRDVDYYTFCVEEALESGMG